MLKSAFLSKQRFIHLVQKKFLFIIMQKIMVHVHIDLWTIEIFLPWKRGLNSQYPFKSGLKRLTYTVEH